MTPEQKQQLADWLINNLQLTSKSNVELITNHVNHYFVEPLESQLAARDAEIERLRDALGRVEKICLREYEDEEQRDGDFKLIYEITTESLYSKKK